MLDIRRLYLNGSKPVSVLETPAVKAARSALKKELGLDENLKPIKTAKLEIEGVAGDSVYYQEQLGPSTNLSWETL